LDEVARSEGAAGSPTASLRDALAEVIDRARLTLALLLHDVGKGQGGGHVPKGTRMAAEVCRRLGLEEDVTADVLFLVSKHLVMSRVSQRRDLTDRALLDGFAETVGTVDRLNMLYLLTSADIRGVGPGTWNEWKASLLAELHAKTRARLSGDSHAAEDVSERVALEERVLDDLHPEFLRSDVHEFLRHLPDRYMVSVAAEDIAHHFEMTRELGSRPVVTHWRQSRKGPFTVLSICLLDRPGVLARIAGALTGGGLDILSVDIFTTDEGVVLDVFRLAEAMGGPGVQAVQEERFAAIDADLAAALEGSLDVAAAVERERARQVRRRRRRKPAPVTVHFEEPEAPGGRTVIEVRADDEPGLVYRISATLAKLGIDISLAKIATEKSHALDVFYVTNARGSALLPEEQAEVERALSEVLANGG
jgi:[protein-PII] uridylyltransferase